MNIYHLIRPKYLSVTIGVSIKKGDEIMIDTIKVLGQDAFADLGISVLLKDIKSHISNSFNSAVTIVVLSRMTLSETMKYC